MSLLRLAERYFLPFAGSEIWEEGGLLSRCSVESPKTRLVLNEPTGADAATKGADAATKSLAIPANA